MTLDALHEGLNIWDRDIKRYIHSDRILNKQEIPKRVTMKGTRYHVAEKEHEG